jgi:hypothetical protein
MNPAEAAQRLGDQLEDAGLDYAIGGALALGVWGAPRLTNDVDLSIFAPATELDRVGDAFDRAGVIFDRADAVRTIERIGMFKGRLGGIVIDAFMSRHPHMDEMQRRRQRVLGPDGSHLYFVSPEDLCVLKLVYGRDKDIADLERLFAVRPTLDLAYVRSWLSRMPVGSDRVAILDGLERRFAQG